VLEANITVQLSDAYDIQLEAADFAAELILVSESTQGHYVFDYEKGFYEWIKDETKAWPVYVLAVDNAKKTVTLKFKGAPKGDYKVYLTSSKKGRLDAENLSIKTDVTVTEISPKQGSALGGTVVTITGENFSSKVTDNPVQIGDALCVIQSTSESQIVCQIEKRPVIAFDNYKSEEVSVDVYLRLSDVASCGIESCTFTFEKPKAEVTEIKQHYN
jgi:hypothetical protein